VRTPLISVERGLFGKRLQGVAAGQGLFQPSGLAEDAISALESRALWSRYGL
jgi:hypothetical protein